MQNYFMYYFTHFSGNIDEIPIQGIVPIQGI